MDCSCSIDVCCFDDCPPGFSSTKYPRARKLHVCGECGSEIHPGTKYEYAAGTNDGFFWTAKTCMACVDVRECFFCSWIYSSVWINLQYSYDEDDIDLSSLEKLSPTARAKFFENIDC